MTPEIDASKKLFPLICADYEKGEIKIKARSHYQNKLPKAGHVWVGIYYAHKGTGQVIYDGAFEITKEAESFYMEKGHMISFILTKLCDRLANNRFTDEEIANLEAMIAQAKAQELAEKNHVNKLPFKDRMTNFLRKMTE